MATRKIKDLAVKIREYVNNAGEKKGEYVNVGSIMEGDNGQYITLNRTFNPAGVPNPENRTTFIVSQFEPKKKSGGVGAGHSNPLNTGMNNVVGFDDMDDDVPF